MPDSLPPPPPPRLAESGSTPSSNSGDKVVKKRPVQHQLMPLIKEGEESLLVYLLKKTADANDMVAASMTDLKSAQDTANQIALERKEYEEKRTKADREFMTQTLVPAILEGVRNDRTARDAKDLFLYRLVLILLGIACTALGVKVFFAIP